MTRARDRLALVQPQRFYVHQQPKRGDRHVYAPRSRFLPDAVLERFERVAHGALAAGRDDRALASRRPAARIDVAARMRAMWDS
jgi:DNA helicase-2/ATP-dependent DNA helicase PcrA